MFARPCSIVVDVKELFGAESKSQVYAHVHNFLKKIKDTNVLFYDDACRLKRYAQNLVRKDASDIARKMATMDMVCDCFHFANHTDKWCKKNCNPYKTANLEDVITEVCEQLFSWLSRFSHITKHINKWRFLFLMLYLLDNHNEDVARTQLIFLNASQSEI